VKPLRVEVVAPKDGARKPARWDGAQVWAACGPVSIAAPLFVVYAEPRDPPLCCQERGECPRCEARYLARRMRDAGYFRVEVEGELAPEPKSKRQPKRKATPGSPRP
jgi:hypothetical protein